MTFCGPSSRRAWLVAASDWARMAAPMILRQCHVTRFPGAASGARFAGPPAWSWSLSSPPATLDCRRLRSPLQHFSVDGTLIEAWASHKSFRPKDGSDDDGTARHVQKRSYDTHASTTDPDSRLDRKAAGR